MKYYRVIKKTYLNKVTYIAQKRRFNLFWCNFLNTEFETCNDAIDAINNDAETPKYELVTEMVFKNNAFENNYE